MSTATTATLEAHGETRVPLLSNEPPDSEYMKEVIRMSASLIRAAKDDSLVSVVCTHDDSDQKSVVLCALFRDEEGNLASYVPVAQLFDQVWSPWSKLTPPSAAIINE